MLQDYVLGPCKEEVGLPVKAGLHEVDMVKRRMQPCYWPGTTHRVIRGSWFVDRGSGYAPLKVCIHLGNVQHITLMLAMTHKSAFTKSSSVECRHMDLPVGLTAHDAADCHTWGVCHCSLCIWLTSTQGFCACSPNLMYTCLRCLT